MYHCVMSAIREYLSNQIYLNCDGNINHNRPVWSFQPHWTSEERVLWTNGVLRLWGWQSVRAAALRFAKPIQPADDVMRSASRRRRREWIAWAPAGVQMYDVDYARRWRRPRNAKRYQPQGPTYKNRSQLHHGRAQNNNRKKKPKQLFNIYAPV